jgi:uncharacterized protein (TIGR02466 family)
MPSANEIFELFPTPFLRCERLLDRAEVAALVERLADSATCANPNSTELSHSRILAPADEPLLADLAQRLSPRLADFGELLFGERLDWQIKEMWLNVLQSGGRQSVHNHANSFASGVLYLSDSHPSANTLFSRGLGGRDFHFSNSHAGATLGAFNADQWMGPLPSAGDLVLFPSYLLHEVPLNRGGLRITLAFNAIPNRLDSWGYTIRFAG